MKRNELEGKKILVAGGTGFIGKVAVKKLSEFGADIYVLTRGVHEDENNIHYLQCDLSDDISVKNCKELVKDIRYDDAVFMAANIPTIGQKKESIKEAAKSTLMPFINFCDGYLDICSKLIYISSVDVLGKCSKYEFKEELDYFISSPYGLAKYCGEFYSKNYCTLNNIPLTILRFSQVYGPNEPVVRIIPIIKSKLEAGQPFSMYTDGTEKRRFLYVEDAAQAIIRAIASNSEGTFNIAGNEVVSMIDLIRMMEQIWNKKLDLSILSKVEGIDNVPSIKKAQLQLEFNPDFDMLSGLKKVWEASVK